MICKKCGSEIKSGGICQHCGADNILIQKARNASLRQYNKGVAFAREGDYSSAIDSLKECILFDKHNFVARNLIGIAYYQTGLVTEALRQWIISTSLRKEKNPANRYIETLQKNPRLLEKLSDGISMYNKALGLFKQGNNDLAVIQLKKAVDVNPSLVEAYNLLTAYYISVKDKSKAKKNIYKVLKIDKKNPRALAYLGELTSTEKNTKEQENKDNLSSTEGYNEFGSYEDYGYDEKSPGIFSKFKSAIRTDLALFAAGIILTSAVFITLVMPTVTTNETQRIDEMQKRIDTLEDENLNGTSTFAVKYNTLEEEYKKLQDEISKYQGEYSVKEQELDIQTAQSYIAGEKYAEAAEILYNLKVDNLSDEDKNNIEKMKTECYPQAGEELYEKGSDEFKSSDFENAKADLKKSLEMAPEEKFSDNALYILAQISEEENDIETAKQYYEKIVNEFSRSDVFSKAERKLNELSSENN